MLQNTKVFIFSCDHEKFFITPNICTIIVLCASYQTLYKKSYSSDGFVQFTASNMQYKNIWYRENI